MKRNLLLESGTLTDVLERLNRGVFGAVLIVDSEEKMVGMFTDGDVRRAILGGASVNDPLAPHMNRDFTFAREADSRQERLGLLNERIRHLPILDGHGRPVDLISWAEMWSIPVVEPLLGGNELNYVSDCLATNWISSQGAYVTQFEEAIAEYIGTRHAVSTSNGTTALHLALTALGIGPGDEVVVPDLTFGASANAVIHTGATPVFADVDPDTWTLHTAAVQAALTSRTRAIMPVHLYGHPARMDSLMELAEEHDLFVVEDCAEALGAELRGERVGSFGHAACFSFFANKIITTGEGGMVVTDDPDLNARMVLLRDHGMSAQQRYWHLEPGFNYRLTNIQAAIGLAQMEQIDRFLDARRTVVDAYHERLEDVSGLRLPGEAEWAQSVFWLYSIRVDPEITGVSRDDLARQLSPFGIETRPVFPPLHSQPAYERYHQGRAFPVTESIAETGLSLPTSTALTEQDIKRVTEAIRRVLDRVKHQNKIAVGGDG